MRIYLNPKIFSDIRIAASARRNAFLCSCQNAKTTRERLNINEIMFFFLAYGKAFAAVNQLKNEWFQRSSFYKEITDLQWTAAACRIIHAETLKIFSAGFEKARVSRSTSILWEAAAPYSFRWRRFNARTREICSGRTVAVALQQRWWVHDGLHAAIQNWSSKSVPQKTWEHTVPSGLSSVVANGPCVRELI